MHTNVFPCANPFDLATYLDTPVMPLFERAKQVEKAEKKKTHRGVAGKIKADNTRNKCYETLEALRGHTGFTAKQFATIAGFTSAWHSAKTLRVLCERKYLTRSRASADAPYEYRIIDGIQFDAAAFAK